MSDETTLGREPIELVEIVLPRCVNTYGVAPCTASGPTGSECYNCRATCQDVDNYRDTPDRHLTPDLVKARGENITALELQRSADLFAAFEVRFGIDPEGIIWEQGGSGTGAYLGVTSGFLVFRAGSGALPPGDAGLGRIAVDAGQFAGKTITLYVSVDYQPTPTLSTLKLWVFDPVELSLVLLGDDTFDAGAAGVWAGTDDGAIGERTVGSHVLGESEEPWSGAISEARFFSPLSAPADMSDRFNASLWLGRGVAGEPIDERYILPCLLDLGTIGTRINLNASDDNYQPIGRRATLDFTAKDFTHSDITQDPYLATRGTDPSTLSTFWRKWLARQKFGKVGALVRVYDGYAGQRLRDYRRRSYVLDKVQSGEDQVSFHCRDVLSRTEFRKAQVPAPSSGLLAVDIDEVATEFSIGGDVTLDYPAAGTVRINDEIMTYTSRAYADPLTVFSGVSRGRDGSSADQHEADDLVQTCRRYTRATIDDVLSDLLFDDAEIEGQLVDFAGIVDEVETYLNAFSLTTLLTEPFGVDTLIGRLSAECSFYLWWDERAQQIRLQAIRAVADPDIKARWTDGENIVANSLRLSEMPKQRLNVVTFYYNPIDFAGDLQKATNFRNGLKVINGTTSLPEQYGNLIQSREVYSIFLTTEAQANQTSSRLAVRYADVPIFAEFYVDAKDRAVWVGDVITLTTPQLVTPSGVPELKRWLVVEAEEIDPGHLVRYVCADITLDGLIYRITENGIGTYTEELFAEGNAFITDNFGLNPDGTTGARIT